MRLLITFGFILLFSQSLFASNKCISLFNQDTQGKSQELITSKSHDLIAQLSLKPDVILRLRELYNSNPSFKTAMEEFISRYYGMKRGHVFDDILPDGGKNNINTRWRELAIKVLTKKASASEIKELNEIENSQKNEHYNREWALQHLLSKQMEFLSYMNPKSQVLDFYEYATNNPSMLFNHLYFMYANVDSSINPSLSRMHTLEKFSGILDQWIKDVSSKKESVNLEQYLLNENNIKDLKKFVSEELQDRQWEMSTWDP